jgi:Ca2+-binding EF-hand superfamily protein
MLASIQRRVADAGGKRDAFLSLFRSFDTDGSGYVSLEELNRGLRRLGHPLSAVELQVRARSSCACVPVCPCA